MTYPPILLSFLFSFFSLGNLILLCYFLETNNSQGYCGSCWAFSATEQIESDYWRATGDEAILSAQQITSCTSYIFGGGCNGGFTENAFDYAEGGVELDSDYPYTSGKAGVTGSCDADSSKYVVKTTGYTTVSSSASGESTMASYVGATGPLSVCVDASDWSSYTGGILSRCGTSVDHCVQAVGIDTSGGYWKVRNSWGTSWGESGFIRLAYGDNTCAIASDANYASTSSAAKSQKKYRDIFTGSTCTGTGEFCCGAPGGDVDNCPSSARTDDCDAKNDCCCG